jgi:hypothetical protein
MNTHRVDGICAHTLKHTEGWGNPSYVRNIVEKTKEDNQKVGKTNQVGSQVLTLRPEHDKIQAQWASNILLKSMLEKL